MLELAPPAATLSHLPSVALTESVEEERILWGDMCGLFAPNCNPFDRLYTYHLTTSTITEIVKETTRYLRHAELS